jgi:hypothetical protein
MTNVLTHGPGRPDLAVAPLRRTVEQDDAPRGYRAAATGLLGVQVALTTWVASRSFFFADDLLYGSFLGQSPFGGAILFRSWFGHLVPGFIAADWTFLRLVGLNWPAAVVVMVAVALAASVALLRLLEALSGRTWRTVVLTALFGLSLPVVTQTLWWGAVLTNLLPLAASIATIGSFLRWARSGRARHLVSMTCCFLLAVAFYEKSVLTAVYIGLLSLLVLDGGHPWRERWAATLRRWPAWACLGVVAVIDGVWYLSGDFLAETGPPPGIRDLAAFLFHSLTEGFAPAFLGLHLPEVTLLGSRALTLVVADAALAGVALITARRSRRARNTWVFFALGFLLNQGVLGWGRVNTVAYGSNDVDSTLGVLGPHMGLLLRYQLENTLLLCVALAVAVPSLGGTRPTRLRLPRAAVALGACALLLMPFWAMSLRAEMRGHRGVVAHGWVDAVRASYADLPAVDRDLGFVEGVVPDWFVYGAMAPYNRYDQVLPQLLPGPRFTTTGERGLGISPDGTVGTVGFRPLASLGGGVCLAPGDPRLELDLPRALPAATWFVRLDYRGDAASSVQVIVHNDGAPPGLLMVSGSYETGVGRGRLVVAPGSVPAAQVTVEVTGPAGVCLDGVEIGSMEPER